MEQVAARLEKFTSTAGGFCMCSVPLSNYLFEKCISKSLTLILDLSLLFKMMNWEGSDSLEK